MALIETEFDYISAVEFIFRSFQEFFERRVLLDTEVWSCSVTGKANLTFDEANESETEARKNLKKLDNVLASTVLYLFSKGKIAKIHI